MANLKFTLTEYDVGNCSLISKDKESLSFSYSTQRGFMSINRSSTITFTDADGNRTDGATIDWLKRTIDIMGVMKAFSNIKINPSGMLNS
ncbi:hypothetical protein BDZ94DRAFT_1261719 [Collybia nuda]|uniref:Uncharacterized protein n=1 Tax=Collybia nuda TaxID=64659 RepID=A0A9P5Y3V5_9AGAR|nr:hypothetical protein BDZ94DRAFT_1261719 [Collybia nuda]